MPTGIALQDEERCIARGELDALVREEARWLGASQARRFGLLASNGCDWVLTDLALLQAGLLNVPLPAYFTSQQLAHAARDAGIDALLTDQPQRACEIWPDLMPVGRSERTGFTLLRRTAAEASPHALPPGTVKITYTSGSTAAPKGVCLDAAALRSVARSLHAATATLGITRHLCIMPLATLLENIGGVYAPLLAGATCILPANTGMSCAGVDAPHLLRTITVARPSSLILVPELLRVLVAAVESGWTPPQSLRFIAVGGAPVSVDLLEQAAALGLPVFQGYGLSECASVVCLNTPAANRIGSVGRPLPHAQVRCDASGQILVRGACMRGYLGDSGPPPDEIATGDLGEIDAEGFVYVRGRMRNLIITSLGRNLSPEWVEQELTREPAIRHALACGEARPYVVALIDKAQADVDDGTIAHAVARANARLPDYAQVRRWAVLPESPSFANGLLTANGRLRRERILARYSALIERLYETDSLRRMEA